MMKYNDNFILIVKGLLIMLIQPCDLEPNSFLG